VGEVPDERAIKKTFSIWEDWEGTIEYFDGDEYRLMVRQV